MTIVADRYLPSELENRYQNYKGLHVLHLSGSDYEMGFQHGAILREAIHRGPIPYFSQFMEKTFTQVAGKSLGSTLNRALDEMVGKKIARQLPLFVQEALAGLADGSGYPLKDMIRGVVLPETFLWLVSHTGRLKGAEIAPRLMVPLFGCSSAVAWGKATQDGHLLHGRNLDYMGVGAWDREAAVLFHTPDKGQKYVSVAAAGLPLGGGTAMNEAGLTLGVHQHLSCDDVARGGLPVGIIGDRVMRDAENLDDARKILDSHTPNASFTYIITSGQEARVMCYEVTPRDRAWFIPEGETFGYTNMFLNKKLAGRERYTYPSQWRSNAGRYHCIQQRLETSHGQIDANTVASILGERSDPQCRLRAPVAMLTTVSSTVFDPQKGHFYVGSEKAPTSNRPYLAFDLNRMQPLPDTPALIGGIPQNREELAAFDAYRESYEAYFNRQDLATACQQIEHACELQPQESIYHYMAGLLYLSAEQPANAYQAFNKAIQLGHPDPERVAAFYLWRARTSDRLGRRHESRDDYQLALNGDPAVVKAASKGIKQRWNGKSPILEFNYADVVSP